MNHAVDSHEQEMQSEDKPVERISEGKKRGNRDLRQRAKAFRKPILIKRRVAMLLRTVGRFIFVLLAALSEYSAREPDRLRPGSKDCNA